MRETSFEMSYLLLTLWFKYVILITSGRPRLPFFPSPSHRRLYKQTFGVRYFVEGKLDIGLKTRPS